MSHLQGSCLCLLVATSQDDGGCAGRLIGQCVIVIKHVLEGAARGCDHLAAILALPLFQLVSEAQRLLVWRLQIQSITQSNHRQNRSHQSN